jgi:hypothetical protein
VADQAVLLSCLADLAATAGKLRTSEWLRTCATLPPNQWPAAPAYKGPVVPAADLDLALWLHAESEWWLSQYKHDVVRWRQQVNVAEAREQAAERRETLRQDERDQAHARVKQLEEQVSVGHRVQLVVAGQWLGHAADKLGEGPGPEYLQRLADWLTDGTPGDEPEPTAERDGLQARLARVEALCAEWETNSAAEWAAGDAAEHVRAALQGDQPTKPEHGGTT